MNAINTTWYFDDRTLTSIRDLILDKPYMNGGQPNSTWDMTTMRSAVYVDGPVNDPSVSVSSVLLFNTLRTNIGQWRSRFHWQI